MLAYGAGVQKIASMVGGDMNLAREIHKKYFATCPEVEKYLNKSSAQAKHYRYSVTPFYNRKRYYPTGKISSQKHAEIGRQGKNHPIQGANADITKLALAYIHTEIKKPEWAGHVKIIGQVHDEILTEVLEDKASSWAVTMETLLLKAGNVVVSSVEMKADCAVASYWNK